MKLQLLFLLMFANLVSCAAISYSPNLDSSLTEAGVRYLAEKTVLVPEEGRWKKQAIQSISHVEPFPKGTIRVLENSRPWYIHEPMLYVLSAGIIPDIATIPYDYSAVVELDGGEIPISLQYERTYVAGWIAGLLWLFPGWEFRWNVSKDEASLRAFYTTINQLASVEESEW